MLLHVALVGARDCPAMGKDGEQVVEWDREERYVEVDCGHFRYCLADVAGVLE